MSTLSASLLSRFEAVDLEDRPLTLGADLALLRRLDGLLVDRWLVFDRVDLFDTLLALDVTDSDPLSAASWDITGLVASSDEVFCLRTMSSDFSIIAD